MDVATVLSVAQTLFATLQCAEVRKLCSIFKYESELEKLVKTVETINNFLLDADSKCQELSHEGQCWVENLKNAVYDADDLFDEYKTIAQQLSKMPGGKLSKKVRRFFSSNNQLLFAYKSSVEVNKLREKLDSLAKNHSDFGFSELFKPVKGREETCSYVYEQSVIGRDADKEAIVDLLLQDETEKNISFVTIVGIGGLGKTTLAQLVFNDLRIKEAFQENTYWVCVSDSFSMKDILGMMIRRKELEFEDLQRKVRNQIEGERYLLVLDDVWSEIGRKWDELKNFLIVGGKGSRILVTSRSQKVARAIGDYPVHKLQGLSEEDSWELFRKTSLGEREDEAVAAFVELGRDIVRKCASLPLSIRVVASLLRGQDITAWESYRRIDLAKMREDEDDEMMLTLMFSYYHLEPALKSCFSFFSVFPQDYTIYKEELISLWSAHNYLVPSGTDDSMEDVGERYFSILLNRCFFQDSKQNFNGIIRSVKMHDLMHDLARKVAGKTRHHYYFHRSDENPTNWLSSRKNTLRSYFNNCWNASEMESISSKLSRLRVLELQFVGCVNKTLPDTVGKLLYLRYLDISYNHEIEMLPKSITKLHNLQTFKLVACCNLKELPEDTNKLVNLRVLDVCECKKLTHMPSGMGKLTCLHTLPTFIIRGDEHKQDELIDLKELVNNLRGDLNVTHHANSNNTPLSGCMDVQLDSLKLKLKCKISSYHNESQELLLKSLIFNHHFQKLVVKNYGGTRLPSWVSGLVTIRLTQCKELQCLPSPLSQLCHLKHLNLEHMEKVEYIESDAPSPSGKFFPSLENLVLCNMAKLKGWWGDNIRWMEKESVFIPSFAQLFVLYIFECNRLTYFPPCPLVKELELENVNEALTFCMIDDDVGQVNPFCLERLYIDNSSIFNSIGRGVLGSAFRIELRHMEDLGRIREGFLICASSLQELDLTGCRGMENLGIEHLTNLKLLALENNIEGVGVARGAPTCACVNMHGVLRKRDLTSTPLKVGAANEFFRNS